MKRSRNRYAAEGASRAPRGARGLKPIMSACGGGAPMSRPARGAWIET